MLGPNSTWQESKEKSLKIQDVAPKVFLAYLEYLYSDKVCRAVLLLFSSPSLPRSVSPLSHCVCAKTPADLGLILGLLALSAQYLDQNLQSRCEKLIGATGSCTLSVVLQTLLS
jgi:hypothetical protein